MITATYSPDDNKLRLYASERLPRELYDRVKAAGFSWAPKQELFVAPMWTPSREDLAIELAGTIGDEDKSLCERAEERSERFKDYSDKRADDAERAHAAVNAICDRIPFGQPILVGHHSERHARKDAERIENGMRRAVKAFETSAYWKQRAAAAVHAAKYKERPDVRARRIKKLEAERRDMVRRVEECEHGLKFWRGEMQVKNTKTGEVRLLAIVESNRDWILRYLGSDSYHYSFEFPLAKYPRNAPASQYEGTMCLWGALGSNEGPDHAVCTLDQARELCLDALNRNRADCQRWIAHYEHRLEYERAMLEGDGGTVADKTGPEVGGACRCWASPSGGWSYIQKVNKVSVTVLDNWGNGGTNFTRTIPFDKLFAVMSRADVEAARTAGTLKDTADGQGFIYYADTTPTPPAATAEEPDKTAESVNAMKETLRAGVQVVSAPQLFPTPPEIAQRMTELADITSGDKVLEPSAGTGNLIAAALGAGAFESDVVAVEINVQLSEALTARYAKARVFCGDFLALSFERFDVILMNPPFTRGADIEHILHARTFLAPDGRLVALCANGPKQNEVLAPLADSWEVLPTGSFASEGTGVNVAMLTMRG